MASSVLESSEEKIYGFKLMRLIVDGGTEVLRKIFLRKHPGNLHNVLNSWHNRAELDHLFTVKHVVTQPQWDKLYPPIPRIPNIQEFDITLLVILLRNICGLSPSSATVWNNTPGPTDNSLEADIVRIKLFRNNFFGHVPGTDITRLDFEARWTEVSSVLRRLGSSQAEIDKLKAEECGEEEVNRVRKEWNESEREVVLKLEQMKKNIESKIDAGIEKLNESFKCSTKANESEKEVVSKIDRMEDKVEKFTKKFDESLKQNQSFTKDILSECLHQYDFKEEIQSFYDNFTEGTREWVFDQISKWLNNKLSDNRAFIISGQAGMGKSTIAAVTCKRFLEHFAACHFFQYYNSRYNDPKFLLQSLAWQLCHVIPEYKQNLTNNLSGNKAQSLNEQNIEGMFSMLFIEPLSKIPDPGRHFLIVIDALDECREEEKEKFVDLITQHFHKLPRFIRFFITGRSETDITHKLEKLNLFFLKPDDERNLNDLRLFFEDKLKTKLGADSSGGLVKKLVDKSGGFMLYVSFLCKFSENRHNIFENEDLPEGIPEIYNRYFKRLENNLKKLNKDKKQFLTFLSVIAVSKRSLPLALVKRLFSTDKDLSIADPTLMKLIDCLSSLIVIKDQSLLFFHKSVRDWLTIPNHDFTITKERGHEALADICVFQMQTLKENKVSSTFDVATVYALQYGIQHILEANIKTVNSLAKLISHVIDLEIVHASVCIDIYSTLSNLSILESYNTQNNSVCEETQTTIRTLICMIRKFTYILKDVPQSFLQHVVNEKDDALSSQATDLLMTRYRGLAYFESVDEKESIEKTVTDRIVTKNYVLEIDISPSEDFLICGYLHKVEFFSLSNLKLLWDRDDVVVEEIFAAFDQLYCYSIPLRRVVFHPHRKVIFPGQLNPVLNFEGKFESGRIMCQKIPNKFTTSCFSHDKTKMVTNYGIHLTVWNLLENKKIVSLRCSSELFSVLFSANDRFIGTTNINEICVFDTENSYSMVSSHFGAGNIKVLVSTFSSDSWFVNDIDGTLNIVKHDPTMKPVTKRCTKSTNVYPGNARAAAKFQAAIDSYCTHSWLHTLTDGATFFILSDESVLFYKKMEREIKLVSLTKLIKDSNMENPKKKFISSLRFAQRSSFSVDGKYIYADCIETRQFLIAKLSCPRSVKSLLKNTSTAFFVPVRDGVFVVRDIKKSFSGKDYLNPGTPELWNFDVTQHLASFPELDYTCDCVSVTPDLVACVIFNQVCFFNVLQKAIVASTPFPNELTLDLDEHEKIKVIACSSRYDVLMVNKKSAYLLQKDANSVDLNSGAFDNFKPDVLKFSTAGDACFSPEGQWLAVSLSNPVEMLYILSIPELEVIGKFSLFSRVSKLESKQEFVDEEHLLCDKYNDCLCLINVKTCVILTCINLQLDNYLWNTFVCSNTVAIIPYSRKYGKFKQIKLWLPQQRKNETELQDCSCLIHGGNINELINFSDDRTENMSEATKSVVESTENMSKRTKSFVEKQPKCCHVI